MRHRRIEKLPRELHRLLQDDAAVFRVGVIADIGAFVDEALAVRVHHDGERIVVALVVVGRREVAEVRRVAFPADRVTARPVTHGCAPMFIAISRPSPVLYLLPRTLARSQPGPRWRARHAALASKPPHARMTLSARELARRAFDFDDDAVNAGVGMQERLRPGVVKNRHAGFLGRLVSVDEPRSAAPRCERRTAPEGVLAVDFERLPAELRQPAHAFVLHPVHGRLAAANQKLAQVGIGAVLRDARHVVEELVFGVGAEVALHLFFAQIGRERAYVFRAVVDEAHQAFGVRAVAAALVLRGALEQQHFRAFVAGRYRRAQRRVSAADDDDVVFRFVLFHSDLTNPFFAFAHPS